MANNTSLPDELLIHSMISDITVTEVKRIKAFSEKGKLDRMDVIALEKYAKIYAILMKAYRENKTAGLISATDE